MHSIYGFAKTKANIVFMVEHEMTKNGPKESKELRRFSLHFELQFINNKPKKKKKQKWKPHRTAAAAFTRNILCVPLPKIHDFV